MGTRQFRVSRQALEVLGALLSAKDDLSGADIARITGLSSGTLYPILVRLEEHRWVQSEWEAGNPSKLGRPRKRFYRITDLGERSAKKEFSQIKSLIGRAD